jgi:ferredoxin
MRYLVTLILILLTLNLAAFDDVELAHYTGNAVFQKGYPYLEDAAGDQYRLLLAPQSLLDSLGIALEADAAIEVSGWLKGSLLLTKELTLNGSTYLLRDDPQKDLYTHHSDRTVDRDACISCWLCIRQCPVDAISRKNGKAYIDPDLCIDCGICSDGHARFKGCPVDAIE